MIWQKHFDLKGTHAFFSPSQPYWLRYTDEKAIEVYKNKKAVERGTKLHEWAEETIKLGIKQPDSKLTIYNYINDAIGFRMDPEIVLRYSPLFYGTADSISFRDNKLRIHDLKTGKGPVHKEQLLVYAALFCLEYGIKPKTLETTLRIYQNNEIDEQIVSPNDIADVMDIIIKLDKVITAATMEEY